MTIVVTEKYFLTEEQQGKMYFVTNHLGSDTWMISANENPTLWGALDFAAAEKMPDDAVLPVATTGDLYLMGEETVETYYTSNDVDFPFERYANGTIDVGLVAAASVAETGGQIFMLGRLKNSDPVVVMISGFQLSRLSNPDIEAVISGFTRADDAEGFVYQQAGNTFYELTFPEADRTFVYHVEGQMWHERKSYGMGRHRASGYGLFNGNHLVGHCLNSSIFRMRHDVYDEDGEPIERIRQTSVQHLDRRRITVPAVEIEFEAGVGLTTGQGSDPQAMLQYSTDGGSTWSYEMWRGMGAIGEGRARCVWDKFGTAREFVFRVVVTDPVKVAIINGYADIIVRKS